MTICNHLWYVWLGRQGNSSEKLNSMAYRNKNDMKHFMNNGKEYLKMTEEDIKYRQGRSRKSVEASYKAAAIAIVGTIVTLVIAAIIS